MRGIDLLALAVLLGLSGAGVSTLARSVVPVAWLALKPWKCNLCMGWWGSLGTVLALSWFDRHHPAHVYAIITMAAFSVSYLTLERLRPPTFPELSGSGIGEPGHLP